MGKPNRSVVSIALMLFHLPLLSQGALPERSAYREKVLGNSSLFSETLGNDQARNLVDEFKFDTPQNMEQAGLTSASLNTHPWSGSYWPIYLGLLANRYGDPKFPKSSDWKQNATYLEQNFGQPEASLLSPAEKYDLLVGDDHFTLTREMLEEGQEYYNHDGKVETWMGICHGWAPASYMTARPSHTIKILAADGQTSIPFLPSDIKALASLLWANGNAPMRSIGGRCNDRNPARDSSGRPTNANCLDTNPGTWHLAIVNQIGVSHRSFVMDAEWSSEVWNQPVLSYNYTYFNPRTLSSTAQLADAQVRLSDFRDDRFHAFRSDRAVSVVGVNMVVTYLSESWPSPAQTDSQDNDATRSVRYEYDLELDESGQIIGGEWYEQAHPDFLWTPAPGTHAESIGDRILERAGDRQNWSKASAVPSAWRSAAKRSSASGQPLAHIVDRLIEFSNSEL